MIYLIHAYSVKASMTHNEYLTAQFLEDNDPISAKSGAQILSLNFEYSFFLFFFFSFFFFLNFLITGLRNSRASTSFAVVPVSLVTHVANPIFLSKNIYTILPHPL